MFSLNVEALFCPGGVRNISNELTIGTKIDAMRNGLKDYAKSMGYWSGNTDFHFTKVFSSMVSEPGARQVAGQWLLKKKSISGKFFGLTKEVKLAIRSEEFGSKVLEICLVLLNTTFFCNISDTCWLY